MTQDTDVRPAPLGATKPSAMSPDVGTFAEVRGASGQGLEVYAVLY